MKVENFDSQFQKELISIVLNDQSFAKKFFSIVFAGPKNKKGDYSVGIFSAAQLNLVINCIYKAYDKNESVLASDGANKNEIKQSHPDRHEELSSLYEDLKSIRVPNPKYHKDEVANFLRGLRLVELRNKIDDAVHRGFNSVVDMSKEIEVETARIANIGFEESKIINFENPFEIISGSAKSAGESIKLGIDPFDKVANNGMGFSKQNTLLFFGGSNDGKSMVVSVEIAVNIAAQGKRVLIFNLEGEFYLLPLRIISCYTGIPISKLDQYAEVVGEGVNIESFKDFFTQKEYDLIKDAGKILENIRIIHASSSKEARYIEYLTAQAEEVYDEWPYEVIISDYSGLAKSKRKLKDILEENIFCFKEFHFLATSMNLLHIAIAQANREGIKEQKSVGERSKDLPVLREYHLGGTISQYQDSGYAISISATADEKRRGYRRFTLLKNRKGMTGVTIGVRGDWGCARPLSGNIEIITGDYEDGPGMFKKKEDSANNPLGLNKEDNNKTEGKDEKEIFPIIDTGYILKNAEPVVRYQKLLSDTQELKNDIINIEKNGEGTKEEQEEINCKRESISDILDRACKIEVPREFIEYCRDEIIPKRAELKACTAENRGWIKKNKRSTLVLSFLTAMFNEKSIINLKIEDLKELSRDAA